MALLDSASTLLYDTKVSQYWDTVANRQSYLGCRNFAERPPDGKLYITVLTESF
jgi:hypothetical protein